MECIEFQKEEHYIRDFIDFSNKLYKKQANIQDSIQLRDLLLERHCLSKYFTLYKFCIYQNQRMIGRFILTEYPNDKNIYIGFIECIKDFKVSRFLFQNAEAFARKKGFSKIIGPVDASFWIRYRLKTNLFEKRPYTGEPYNLEYYLNLFLDSGYRIEEKYTSTIYYKVPKDFQNKKYIYRRMTFEKMGYQIIIPNLKAWDRIVEEIYHLIQTLYKDFPIYKEISLKDFTEQFLSFKKIINMRMVRIAYYQGKAVGFYISLPNYYNLIYHTNKWYNIFQIIRLKNIPKEYIMLYMGVLPEHRGLGSVLVQSIIEELKENGLISIGALQREGNISQFYAKDLIKKRYEYVLLGKDIDKR